jgi:mRNA interferase MazF
MQNAGQIVYLHFPQVNLVNGKLRPALLLAQLPGKFDDWLVCMISTQLQQYTHELDEIITPADPDFCAVD